MVSLLTLLDDIVATLDDVAVMTKVAVQKTSVLMSDDLAVNAGVVHGVRPDRELPMVRAIFMGSLLNKVYCVSGVLLFMALYPPVIQVIMFVGGVYLSYEGVHKIIEKLFHRGKPSGRSAASEKEKIKGAVRTDLILSIEIIVIAKSSISGSFTAQIVTLIGVGLIASLAIYGLVALIVKIDDFGLYLIRKGYPRLGLLFVQSMPYLMRLLGILGTVAMLLVGGGIIVHIFHWQYLFNEHLENLAIGLLLGSVVVGLLALKSKLFKKSVPI